MPWSNQSGGNGSGGQGPKGPWGSGGSNNSGMRPPDLDELLRRLQENLKRFLPAGGLGRGGWAVAGLAVAVLWLLSGFYIVSPYEQGVVLQFGKFIRHTQPGVNYHLPWPIETAYTPEVTRQKQTNIGYRITSDNSNQSQTEDVPDESLMLTGDENIVDINFTVFWQIKDANAYLFNVENPEATVKAVAESAMREAVGQDQMDLILTSDRERIQVKVQKLMQEALDSYRAGIQVTDVQMQKAEPPDDVRAAYLDVQAALADQDRKRNEAEAYANQIIPQARGEAAQIVQDAEAYRQQVIAEATGAAKRFLLIDAEYKKAPEVTRRRIYLETMTQVLAPMNKVIVDDSAKGVVPYFQLPMSKVMAPPSAPQRRPGDQSSAPTPAPPTAAPSDQGGGQ
ncbi:MAG: FtsH protease activity modulator HflK [Alphaproteobacteria bacterium]|nr:FtsH protease activity modulator HflK [Alphaproteobacteria bacterium]MDE2163975.1 FtsH protease activity modulator HflK [Alphaproteobacteria bacterium]MDE2266636.1 FtsH protease activity modulator HflK [Alphaproteobacteria bacterium]MDE2500076.1 FtsH protease activity modulator HflK [Alphaproteobacteria bacterium]